MQVQVGSSDLNFETQQDEKMHLTCDSNTQVAFYYDNIVPLAFKCTFMVTMLRLKSSPIQLTVLLNLLPIIGRVVKNFL